VTVTVHAVDLDELERRWRTGGVADAVRARPGGRVATLGAYRGRFTEAPAAVAAELHDALVFDLARASLHDAPYGALAEVCGRLARAAGMPELELAALDRAPLAFPAAPGRAGALVVWLEGTTRAAAARAAAEAIAQPRGSELGRELLEALAPVLDGPVVLAQVIGD
jgi:hypothetical protein